MDKKEKVIRGLECCRQNTPDDPFQQCGACPYNINGIYVEDCRSVLSGDALELLKELEPVKPRCEEYFGNRSARCGYCNAYIVGCYKYCPGCGRAVKWND